MHILTDIGLLAVATDSNIEIKDFIGNVSSLPLKSSIENTLVKEFNINPIFLFNGPVKGNMDEHLYDVLTSIIIAPENPTYTYATWSEEILSKCQEIEWIATQVALGRKMNDEELSIWQRFYQIDDQIKNCQFSSLDYEKAISELSKESSNLTKSLQSQYEIIRLVQVVRYELDHAEVRLKESIKWIIEAIIDTNKKNEVKKNKEIIKYGFNTDQIGWCITDMVKSLSTSLDTLCKLINFIKEINHNNYGKVKSVLAGHIENYVPKGKEIPAGRRQELLDAFSLVKPLINLRHELTHNQTLYPVRQPAFIGHGTQRINNKSLAYGEIMWWDTSGDHYCRASGRTGFFKQNRSAILEASSAFRNTLKLIDLTLKTLHIEMKQKATNNSINEVLLMKSTASSLTFYTSSIEQLT